MLNNETTYSNGESQLSFKMSINVNQFFLFKKKHVVNCNNKIGGCCTTNFEKDEKSYKSLEILKSLT
jgi:S-methylmethionine-dependent homocysteine/selenocysteine methylase